MDTSADTLSLDGYDLLEDAAVANAPAGQTRLDTADPTPRATVEPTPPAPAPAPAETTATPPAVAETTLPAPALAEVTKTPPTVAETTLPALTPAETMASPQASTEEEPGDSKKGEPIDTAV